MTSAIFRVKAEALVLLSGRMHESVVCVGSYVGSHVKIHVGTKSVRLHDLMYHVRSLSLETMSHQSSLS